MTTSSQNKIPHGLVFVGTKGRAHLVAQDAGITIARWRYGQGDSSSILQQLPAHAGYICAGEPEIDPGTYYAILQGESIVIATNQHGKVPIVLCGNIIIKECELHLPHCSYHRKFRFEDEPEYHVGHTIDSLMSKP